MDWHGHIETIRAHIVGIQTPESSGAGFLVHRRDDTVWVATASHVLRDAMTWKQVVTIEHPDFNEPLVLMPSDEQRRIWLHGELDSACITFRLPGLRGSGDDSFPEEAIEQIPPAASVKPGVEVGWLGYPYLAPGLCFFSGHISAYRQGRYFIDGVAIEGVSGGPAFHYRSIEPTGVRILGSVSSYNPNRLRGETLPGLMVADDCTLWQNLLTTDTTTPADTTT